jgi:hypothetical protein
VAPVVAEAPPHLDRFHGETAVVLGSHDPQNVRALFRVNGARVDEVDAADAEIDPEIETPDRGDPQVTSTTDDGEVPELKKALKSFIAYMATARQPRERFTLALSGPYGPCNGCKQRIQRFLALWQGKVRELLAVGVQAELIVTYQYSNAPQVMRDNYYGWREDERLRSPYFHTEVANAVGARARG